MSRGLYWLFTINNYTENELVILRNIVSTNDDVNFVCFGLEVAPTTGTPHVQGYVQLCERKRKGQVCTLLGGRARVALASGSSEDNRKYCSKTRDQDETPNEIYEEYGDARNVGRKRKKSDNFDNIVTDIKNGATLKDIIEHYPTEYIKFHAGIDKVFKSLSVKKQAVRFGPYRWNLLPQLDFEKSYLLYGASGIGKTTYIVSLFPNCLFVSHLDNLKAFASGEYDAIVFDDMSFTHLPDRTQLYLVDQDFDRSIHVRYGTVTIPAKTPKFFLHNRVADIVNLSLPEIRRRVDVIKMTEDNFFFE